MKDVLVIGAGVAGINSSTLLADAGFNVTLAESRSFVGGKVFSFYDKNINEIIDNGQHIFAGAYHNFFNLLEKLGTKHNINIQSALKVKFIEKNKNSYSLDTSIFPGKIGTLMALLKVDRFNSKDKFLIARFFIRFMLNSLVTKDISALELLINESQNNNLLKYFWNPLIISACNGMPEVISAKLFINVMKKAFFSNKNNASLAFSKAPLLSLIDPIGSYLDNYNSQLLLNKKAIKVIFDNNRISSVLFDDNSKIKADAYVFAIPASNLKAILPDNIINFFPILNHLKFSPITSLYLWYEKNFIDDDFIGIIDSPIHWIFNLNKIHNINGINNKNFGRYALTISSSEYFANKNNNEILDICLNEIQLLFPESKNIALKYSKVINDKKATPVFDAVTEEKRPKQKTIIENMFIAGDWTNTGLPATIEGAAVSGYNAAKEIINF